MGRPLRETCRVCEFSQTRRGMWWLVSVVLEDSLGVGGDTSAVLNGQRMLTRK